MKRNLTQIPTPLSDTIFAKSRAIFYFILLFQLNFFVRSQGSSIPIHSHWSSFIVPLLNITMINFIGKGFLTGQAVFNFLPPISNSLFIYTQLVLSYFNFYPFFEIFSSTQNFSFLPKLEWVIRPIPIGCILIFLRHKWNVKC